MNFIRVPLITLFTLGVLVCGLAHGETLWGRVVGVADGDTVTVLDESKVQHRIRLAGIDAPEKRQDFGTRSSQSLSELVFHKAVRVEYAKKDRYGRIVGKVLVNNMDASLVQIKRGMAWHYKAYEREQSPEDRALYAQSETDAQNALRGLWGGKSPVAPWEFRKNRR